MVEYGATMPYLTTLIQSDTMSSYQYIMYARKSTDDKSRQVRSITDQIAELWQLAKQHGLDVIDVLVEKLSAKRPGRPVFDEMLRRIEKGEAQGVLAWHPDRLARNSRDGGHLIDLLDIGTLCDLKFPTFTFENSASGKMMLAMMFSQSKYYVDSLSENIKRGKRRKVAEGIWPGPALLGYQTDKQRKVMVAHEKTGEHVRRAFELFATGNYTLEQIASVLREAGAKGCRGCNIAPSSVQRMLMNPVYYGAFRFKGELHDGVHEALISKLLFDRCQKVMSSRSKHKSKGLKPFLYRGLFRCSVCGGVVTCETQKGHTYLHCSKRMEPCKHEYRPAVREESITEQINAMLQSFSIPDDWADSMLTRLEAEQDVFKVAAGTKREALSQRRQGLVTKLRRAEEGWLDGVVPITRYREIQSGLTAERQSIDAEIKDLERHGERRFEPMARFISATKTAKKVASVGSPEEKVDLFKKIGSNPQLVARQLSCRPRGAWKVVEKPALLTQTPDAANAASGALCENIACFTRSGGGGIRTHGKPKPTPVFKTGAINRSATPPRVGSANDMKDDRGIPVVWTSGMHKPGDRSEPHQSPMHGSAWALGHGLLYRGLNAACFCCCLSGRCGLPGGSRRRSCRRRRLRGTPGRGRAGACSGSPFPVAARGRARRRSGSGIGC